MNPNRNGYLWPTWSGWLRAMLVTGMFLIVGPMAAATELELESEIDDAFRHYRLSLEQKTAAPLIDLELFLIALVYKHQQQVMIANQYQQYLLEFYPQSSLVPLIGPIGEQTPFLTGYDPEPLFSRLVKDVYHIASLQSDGERIAIIEDFVKVMMVLVLNENQQRITGLLDFFHHHRQSLLAGWVGYYLAWQHFIAGQHYSEFFYQLWQQQPQHPVGSESLAASDVSYFDPRQVGRLSIILPGWGEGYLEPGLRQAGGQLYYEILYLAGAIGFAVAAQQHNRIENLTASIIFSNLLFFNHLASANRAYVMAMHRNYSEQKEFNRQRFDHTLLAPGQFHLPHQRQDEKPSAEHGIKLGLFYQLTAVSDELVELNWIKPESDRNLGIYLAYFYSGLTVLKQKKIQVRLGLSPEVYGLSNKLAIHPDNQLILEPGLHQELMTAINLVITNSWQFSRQASFQVNLLAGRGHRWRYLSLADYHGDWSTWVTTAGLTVSYQGVSGHFWEIGLRLEDGQSAPSLDILDQVIELNALSWKAQFNLGIVF